MSDYNYISLEKVTDPVSELYDTEAALYQNKYLTRIYEAE